MNLRESILNNTFNRVRVSETKGNDVFTIVSKAFAHDFLEEGEDVIDEYVDVFGESTRPFFDFLADNENMLTEFVLGYEGSLMEADDLSISHYYEDVLMEDGDMRDDFIRRSGARVSNNFPPRIGSTKDEIVKRSVSASDMARSQNNGGQFVTNKYYPKDEHDNDGAGQVGVKHSSSPDDYKNATGYGHSKDVSRHLETGNYNDATGYGHSKNVAIDNSYENATGKTAVADAADKAHEHVAASPATAAKAALKTKVTKGFLARLWDKIKEAGHGIKSYFAEHPGLLRTLGIAGGIGAGALLIRRMMKKAKENKQRPATA